MAAPDGPHIVMTFGPDGSVKVEPKGYGGSACHAATEPYERRLAGDRASQPTDEALAAPAQAAAQQQVNA